MLEIRELKPSDIDQYVENYLNAYPAFKTLDDTCREEHKQRNLRNMQLPDVDYIGMFDGSLLVASMKLVHFQMNLYGTMVPALGLMSLAVHPLQKKKGHALKMMKYYEAKAAESGESVAPLLPFNITFYRMMGYGLGSKRALYHLPTGNLPKHDLTRQLRFLGKDDFDAMIACYDAAAEMTHGMIRKTGEELNDMRADTVTRRLGAYDGESMTGYMAYHFEEASDNNFTQNRIVVDEMIYHDSETLLNFLEYLRRQADLVQSVVLTSGEENFYHILSDPQDVSMEYLPYGYLQVSKEFIGYMYKIVDYPEFFKATANRPAGKEQMTVRIEYMDEFAKEERVLTLNVGGTDGGWRLVSEEETPDITLICNESNLNAWLMNGARLMALVEIGAIQADNTDAARRLDSILYYSQKPYSNTDF